MFLILIGLSFVGIVGVVALTTLATTIWPGYHSTPGYIVGPTMIFGALALSCMLALMGLVSYAKEAEESNVERCLELAARVEVQSIEDDPRFDCIHGWTYGSISKWERKFPHLKER